MGLEEEEDSSERNVSRKARPEVITFTEEETAQLAKIRPQESATVSEQVLVQSAAEKDRISEMKDRQAELEAEPKHANCCSYCPKSFKKPSDLVRCGASPRPRGWTCGLRAPLQPVPRCLNLAPFEWLLPFLSHGCRPVCVWRLPCELVAHVS